MWKVPGGAPSVTVARVLTDNAKSYHVGKAWIAACAQLNIGRRFIKPGRPWTNGKAERFNRTLQTEWAYATARTGNDQRTAALDSWLTHYNTARSPLHIDPYIGAQPVARLSGSAVDAWMRNLETSGRADGQSGLSARTVRYVFTILRSALGDAVKQRRLAVNPTDRSTPPSRSEARPPEMQAWTAPELARFLRWADTEDPDLAMGWRPLAATGMRRGEALALRWRDVDLDASRLAVRRSVGVVKAKGAGEQLVEGPTKTGQSRVVDLDAGTVAALRAYRAARELLALDLLRDSALVLSNLDGTHRHPERFSRRFSGHVAQARKALGEERLPMIRLHDLRHTHATVRSAHDAAARRRRAGEGGLGASGPRQRYHHAHRVPACPPRHGARGGRPLRGAARGLIRGAKYHAGITRASEALQQDTPGS